MDPHWAEFLRAVDVTEPGFVKPKMRWTHAQFGRAFCEHFGMEYDGREHPYSFIERGKAALATWAGRRNG